MTDSEAIKFIKNGKRLFCYSCREIDEQTALNLAISALQEREERAKGCEYCTNERKCPVCRWNMLCRGTMKNGKCTAKYYKFESNPFCHKCGRPLKGNENV